MRKALVVAAIGALVVVLYGAAGAWLAPRFVRDALVDAAAEQGFTLELREVRTQPFTLRVALEGIELRGPRGRRFAAARGGADLSWASLWRRAWIVRELVVEDGTAQFAAQDPALEAAAQAPALEQMNLRARDLSTGDAPPGSYEATARLAGGAGQIVSRGGLSLEPLALHAVLVEAKGLTYEGISLAQATLEAPKVPIPPREPLAVSLRASVAPQGKIAALGRLDPQSLRANLDVQFESLPLAPAQRWLPVKVASGALSGKGTLRIGKTTAYEGVAALRGLRLEEPASGALLLAVQQAETDSLKLGLAPVRIEAGELVARAPEGRLVIAQDGSVNFAAALPKGGQGGPVRVALERLRIEKGTLHFADRSLANPFEVTVRELAGSITGLGNASSEPARIRLAGRVQPYGTARIRGTVDLDAPAQLADIRADLRNLRLEAFNPYIAKFAGYRIESGRLSAQLRYNLREGRLVGSNSLVLERIQLGEKLASKGLFDLPLELAVALLADSEGRIDLDIPVRGNLKDPQFDLGTIIARAAGNALKKVVTAPFRALAALFGGADRDPGAVAFDPGSAALPPPAEEEIAELAKALEQRPRIGVRVHGAYDPARDLEALRLRAARSELAKAAGVDGAPDLSNPKVVRAAERLFLKRVGDRAELRALRKGEPRYGRALLQRLAAAVPADVEAPKALARARAQAVRAALLEHGVDPARVRVAEDVVEKPADEEGVPTDLSVMAT